MGHSRGKQWFVDLMHALGLSQSEVARRMGVDKSAVSLALDGRRQFKLSDIDKIATILGATLDEVTNHAKSIPKKAGPRKKDRKGAPMMDAVGTSDQSETALPEKAGFMEEQTEFFGAANIMDELNGFAESPKHTDLGRSARPHPLFGCLKGVITLLPDVDLTEPADPDLADYLDRKYGPEVRN
jgi:transcriptional regulator with XRE-family HTH domain